MSDGDLDTLIRMAAFELVRMLAAAHDHLTNEHLAAGFNFRGERIPPINPQRGIFKPKQMRVLLSIRTVFPRAGWKAWYDDQRDVHRQIFEGDEAIDYAFMGDNPNAPDNRWLRGAYENAIPVIYFLGVAPGCYQAVLLAFISDWNATTLKASVIFGTPDETGSGAVTECIGTSMRLADRQAAAPSSILSRGLSLRRTVASVQYHVSQNRFCWMLRISSRTRMSGSDSPSSRTGFRCRSCITLHSMLI
jgi:hypothetical protein